MGQAPWSALSSLPLGFGGASISGEGAGYGFGEISEKDAQALLEHAFDQGIRLFDTAPIYGFGLSEQRMGKAFAQKREEVFLVSKSGVSWHDTKRVNMTNDPVTTQKMLEQSLRDLKTDYIDLYMIHWPDQNVDIRKPMEVLARAKSQGKIRHIGLCNTYKEDLQKALEVERVEAVQSQFNLFETSLKTQLFDFLKENQISFMSWGTLDKGILTGRVTQQRKFDASDCRSWAPWWKEMDFESRFQALEKLKPVMKKYDLSGVELAIGYNLAQEGVDMVLCGARNAQQIDGVVSALNKKLSAQAMSEIEACLA